QVAGDNQDDNVADRLKYFTLQAYSDFQGLKVNYTDPNNAAQSVYYVDTFPSVPIDRVSVYATMKDKGKIYLTLCEVEIYG
ncbi:multiple epidermal growth factor-like domains protein 10, partial [Biomphalaria glabrata]